jgi:hypothetical protein
MRVYSEGEVERYKGEMERERDDPLSLSPSLDLHI